MTDSSSPKQQTSRGDSSAELIPTSNRVSVLYFCIVNFLWWMGLYLYVPIFPVYIQETGVGLDTVGVILSAYSIPQVLLRIPLGIWSDRMRRRKSLVAGGIVFTSIGALGLALAADPWLLFLSRMVTGIGAATWVIFPLYFNSYYPAGDDGRAIGVINFVRSIALIAATAGSGFIAEGFGLNMPFFIAAVLGLPALTALLLTREIPVFKETAPSRQDTLAVVTRPLLLIVSLMAILLHFAIFTGVFGFIPIYAAEIGASDSALGLITMINLGFSAVGSLLAVTISSRLSYRLTIILSSVLIGASLAVIPLIDMVAILMAVQVIFGLGSGILGTLFMVLSIRGLPPQQQATAMGVFQAVYAIGMLAGPLTSGFLGSSLGLSNVFYLSAALNIFIVLLAFLPVFSHRLRNNR
jgi:predicted MFS family arabinose efflux permease